MKILYLYSGTRKNKFFGKAGVDYPDTQFYGLNHLSEFGVDAEYKEPCGFGSFRLRHFFSFFMTRGYDVVFGSSLLYPLFWKKIFGGRAKFVILNIGLTRTIVANKNKLLKLRLISWLLNEVSAVVCLSSVQKKYLEERFDFLRDKVFFAPLGVDVDYYQPNFGERKNYILSVGRDNGRDYKTVIDTARLMPNEEFHIVCSERNLRGIENIPQNVKVFLDLPFADLAKKYQEAKLMLLITHDDNFMDGSDCSGQTVLLDAMASGLPVIASRKQYMNDYAEDKKDIVLVNFYDAVSIKNAIEMFRDDGFRMGLAKSARQRVEKDFSTKKMAEKLSIIFNKI